MAKPIIIICSSANFYKVAVDLQKKLQASGFRTIVPLTAEKMKLSGNFDAGHYRTWLRDDKDYHKKTALMREHLTEVAKGDVCLVVNERKHDIDNYIGGNVLMEMALAFHLNKPIYLLNDVPSVSMFLEEVIGMQPIPLKGNIQKLIDGLK